MFSKCSKVSYRCQENFKEGTTWVRIFKRRVCKCLVVLAAKSVGIPVYIHESDITPGLANKIAGRFATRIFVTFRKTLEYLPDQKSEFLGLSSYAMNWQEATRISVMKMTDFDPQKQIMLVMGGLLGAASINSFIRNNLDALRDSADHPCGRGNYMDDLKRPDMPTWICEERASASYKDLWQLSSDAVGQTQYMNSAQWKTDGPHSAASVPKPGRSDWECRILQRKRVCWSNWWRRPDLDTFNKSISHIENNRSEIVKRMKAFEGGFKPEN